MLDLRLEAFKSRTSCEVRKRLILKRRQWFASPRVEVLFDILKNASFRLLVSACTSDTLYLSVEFLFQCPGNRE
jgi:hypothetical protein